MSISTTPVHSLHPDVKHDEACVAVMKFRGFDGDAEIWDNWCIKHRHWLNGAPAKKLSETLLRGIVETMKGLDRAPLKAWLRTAIEKIVVDPSDLSSTIYYAIPAATGVSVASPRGFEPRLPP